LFGHLKPEITEFTARSPDGNLSETPRIFAQIPKETRVAVCNEGITRLEWIIERNGDYYHID
jgi:hypothetical protein